MPFNSQVKLSGRRILVVEDQYFIAEDVARALKEAGGVVVGPVANRSDAEKTLASEKVDGAVLDVNLNGDSIFPLAEELRRQGIPFLFLTGYAKEVVPEVFADVPHVEKPHSVHRLLTALEALTG
jgi:DNA-binding response OmpR family regulator